MLPDHRSANDDARMTTPSNSGPPTSAPSTSATATITLAGARRVLDAAIAAAGGHGIDVCISVCDPGGNPVLTARMDGAPLLSQRIADDKAYTVAAFNGMPTGDWWSLIEGNPELVAGLVKTDRLIVFAGGVPIRDAGGALVGAIGVAGGSSAEDERCAIAGASAF